jgi:ergothioneine biosynthesis protein EgtB
MSARASARARETVDLEALARQFRAVRAFSRQIAAPLQIEDMVVQTMPDISPTKWHWAHTSWFFETFVLERWERDFEPFHTQYRYLFNSYYQQVGPQFPRPQRGLLSRPTVDDVRRYRESVDARVGALFEGDVPEPEEVARVLEVGIHHEQQHQELMYTDIKHVLGTNPLRPAYGPALVRSATGFDPPREWQAFEAGTREIGHPGPGFAYDNELPRHQVLAPAFRLATRPVTTAGYLEFVEDGGYERPELWLSDGWDCVRGRGWRAPFYWEQRDGEWWQYTLAGMRALVEDEPVCHVSYYEADAFATWAGARLPTEVEWETAAAAERVAGNLATGATPHPGRAARPEGPIAQLFGDVWEWTASPYGPYPGFRPPSGALGEYNGKFMCNQFVLRGGSCATPSGHVRPSYRNFFPPDARWQFSGLRLARSD